MGLQLPVDAKQHNSQQTVNEQNKAALRGLEDLAIETKTMSQIALRSEDEDNMDKTEIQAWMWSL